MYNLKTARQWISLTLCGPETTLAHARSVKGTSGVLCFGHGQPSISSLHLTSLWRHELLQILRLGQSLFEGPTRPLPLSTRPLPICRWPFPFNRVSICMKTNVCHPPNSPSLHSLGEVAVGGGWVPIDEACVYVCAPYPPSLPHPPITDPTLLCIRCTLPWCCFF